MIDKKSARLTQKGKIERCKIGTKCGKLTPKVLNWHKDIYIDKVGSNKFQKWQFRFRIDTKGSKFTNVLKAKISVITVFFDKLGLK